MKISGEIKPSNFKCINIIVGGPLKLGPLKYFCRGVDLNWLEKSN